MIGHRDEDISKPMINVVFRQRAGGQDLEAVLQKLYLCASVEFLMAVTEFFLQALPQSVNQSSTSAPSDRLLQSRRSTEPRTDSKTSKIRTLARVLVYA